MEPGTKPKIKIDAYSKIALPHLKRVLKKNAKTMELLVERLARDVKAGRSLFVFGSGHSALFSLELYHRAGGASFVVPVIADYLLPSAGPRVVRLLERTSGTGAVMLDRFGPRKGEMVWIASQSGINSATVDFALESKKRGLATVAFTSLAHSQSVTSRHPSGKRLFEVCDEVVDLGGVAGDAAVPITSTVSAGPLSTLGAAFLGHSILVAAVAKLERAGTRCVYTSVNTPEGEARNRQLEEKAKKRDFLLR